MIGRLTKDESLQHEALFSGLEILPIPLHQELGFLSSSVLGPLGESVRPVQYPLPIHDT